MKVSVGFWLVICAAIGAALGRTWGHMPLSIVEGAVLGGMIIGVTLDRWQKPPG
jgi:hypothetical protein